MLFDKLDGHSYIQNCRQDETTDRRLQKFSPVIAVSLAPNRYVKLHLVVLVVCLRLPQVPLDARPSQHHPADGGTGRGAMRKTGLPAQLCSSDISADHSRVSIYVQTLLL